MKAIIFEKNGTPEKLVLRDVEKPIPTDNQVLIEIHAVSINAADYRSMRMGIIPKSRIFGADVAGRVAATGAAVTGLKPGDAVVGDLSGCGFGGFAEYVAAPASLLALKPENLSYEDAAAIPLAGGTALQGLRNIGKIQPGQRVLICGAGGGVGTYAVQLAKIFGAHVTAVCGPRSVDLVRSLGADSVIDYSTEDFTRSPGRYDLILGVNGSSSLSEYRRLLNPRGIYVMVGGPLSQVFSALVFGPLLSLGSRKFRALAAKPNAQDTAYLLQLAAEGKLKPVIEQQVPLEQTPQAMHSVSQGHTRGKVIIQVK